jgi:hypothetical protein
VEEDAGPGILLRDSVPGDDPRHLSDRFAVPGEPRVPHAVRLFHLEGEVVAIWQGFVSEGHSPREVRAISHEQYLERRVPEKAAQHRVRRREAGAPSAGERVPAVLALTVSRPGCQRLVKEDPQRTPRFSPVEPVWVLPWPETRLDVRGNRHQPTKAPANADVARFLGR